MNLTSIGLTIIAVALGVLRVMGHKSEAFQAVAHLYVGGLFGAFFAGRVRLYLYLAIGLSLTEAACFLLGIGK